MKTRPILAIACFAAALAPASAQESRNINNSRFATVASGPMQAMLVETGTNPTSDTVRRLTAQRVMAARRSRDGAVSRYMAALRKTSGYRGEMTPGIADIVMLKSSGRLVLPRKTRAGDITFVFPATSSEPGGWQPAFQQDLRTIIDIVYPELKSLYGDPAWTGTIKIINGDTLPAGQLISDPNALSGGVLNLSTNEITFAQYHSAQTTVLNLTQMLILAFRGPSSISYDAWERGMARAATLATIRNVLPILSSAPSAAFGGNLGNLSVADPLWHALDRYDLLNQPPLGNDRFFPVAKVNGEVNTPSFPLMLVARLEMSGSAWLKVATEDPSFFRTFNQMYYTALASQPTLKNDVPALKLLARAALTADGATGVEGRDFLDWYQRQFVLDTSVSPGAKLYAEISALRPDTAADDDFSLGVILTYFQTGFDGSANSDETNLAGTAYPIYWDFPFQNRLFIGAQYERVDVRDGIGPVAPTFFNTIGGDAALEGRMRVALDFPINQSSLRIVAAPRSMGKLTSANNFWGTVVGADTGTIKIEADGISSSTLDVKQGAFGAQVDPALFSIPRRATVTFTPPTGPVVVSRVNTGYNEYIATVYASEPVASRTRVLEPGPRMVTFPIRPLQPKPTQALLDPLTDLPLFNDGNLLMATWNQNLPGDDKYVRSPSLDPLQPGRGYWTQLAVQRAVKIIGRTTDQEVEISQNLVHGWNQFGSPYEVPVELASLRFQYLADNVPVDLATAVSRGWIVAADVPGVGKVSVYGFDSSLGYVPAVRLEAWTGYWIRVLVSEGVTITYHNPSRASRAARQRAADIPKSPGWSVPITVRSAAGLGATAYIGQSPSATAGFDANADALMPPLFSRSSPAISFDHTDWGANSGSYFSDIHRLGTRDTWSFIVTAPDPTQTYTVSWPNSAAVPRNLRLVLIDQATGRRQYLHSTSSYSFVPGDSPSRNFQITVEDRSRNGLRILNAAARTSRASGGRTVEIAYDLSQGAIVTTEIRSGDGRMIRRLDPGRVAGPGRTQLIWDTRDDRAITVPSGAYLVQITARSPEGDVARTIQPVTVIR